MAVMLVAISWRFSVLDTVFELLVAMGMLLAKGEGTKAGGAGKSGLKAAVTAVGSKKAPVPPAIGAAWTDTLFVVDAIVSGGIFEVKVEIPGVALGAEWTRL